MLGTVFTFSRKQSVSVVLSQWRQLIGKNTNSNPHPVSYFLSMLRFPKLVNFFGFPAHVSLIPFLSHRGQGCFVFFYEAAVMSDTRIEMKVSLRLSGRATLTETATRIEVV